jgi:formate hydrogenlyase subunit 6/NADH:ubiquinone oxidoreductase subunit I
MCSVYLSQQKFISLYSIYKLVSVKEMHCVFCRDRCTVSSVGTKLHFILSSFVKESKLTYEITMLSV